MRNGDWLDGKLQSIDRQHGLLWSLADASAPIEFKFDAVSQVFFHPPPAPAQPDTGANFPCKVFLAGGDILEGSLAACDPSTLSLQTWYAGLLKIPRASLRSVYFPPNTPDAFTAFGSEGWTQGSNPAMFANDPGQWTFRDGAVYAAKSASLARDLKMPTTADLQFDLAWTGDLTLSVALYTDSLQPLLLRDKDTAPDFAAFYSMRFLNMGVEMTRIKKGEPIASLSQVMVTAFTQTNRAHIELRIRQKTATLAFSVDGQNLTTWTDPNGFVGAGSGIRFVHNGGGLIKISDLRVTPWDGVSEDGAAGPAGNGQAVILTNANLLNGPIEKIADGKVTLKGGRSEVPLAQVRRLIFGHASTETVPVEEGLTRALFPRGGSLAFHLESWSPEGLDIRSPAFGSARFNPNAFIRLTFPTNASPVTAPRTP
jgi:hypothetical protein